MTAPLSLSDKQYQYLLGLYGPGLSYADMLSKYRGGGKSLSDLNYAAYLGSPTASLADNMKTLFPGSGSLSDNMYADPSGGVVTTITNLQTNPRPASITSWQSNDNAKFTHSYANNEISVDRQATAGVNLAASVYVLGMAPPYNPVLKSGVNYQRSVEIWVDASATVGNVLGQGGFVGGQVLVPNQWTRVTEQFLGTGAAVYPTALVVTMPGVGTGIHTKFRKSMVCENPTGRELAYADGNSFGWSWDGAANASTSKGPATFVDPLDPINSFMATAPFYIAHRGAGDVWPEHTMVAYQGAHDAGIKAIEVSAQLSVDNWWFCLHDAGATGLDRATNGTGDPKTKTQAELLALNIDIANCGPYWVAQNLKIPSLISVLDYLLSDRTVVFLESKDYSAAAQDALITLLQTRYPTKYRTQIIWKQSATNTAGMVKASTAGMRIWCYIDFPLDNAQVNTVVMYANYIGVPRYDGGTGLSDAEIDTVIAAVGQMKSISWEPKRRSEVSKLLAKGVDGFVSPTAPYADDNVAALTQDIFASGKWAAGDSPYDSSRTFLIDSGTALFNNGAVNASVMMGSFCPIASTSYEIEFEMKYDVLPGTTTFHSGLVLCKPDDQKYLFAIANTTGGYHIVFRVNGQLQLYKHDAGTTTGTQVGTTIATTALTTVDWAKVRVKVTPAAIEIQRMDGTPSAIMSVADLSYRGQYIHLSRNHSSTTEFVRYRNLKVTNL